MSEVLDKVVTTAVKNHEQAAQVMDKLFSVAHTNRVFDEPVTAGEHTVITASEVSVGAGFGFGLGGGGASEPAEAEPQPEEGSGFGGGGGGGGASTARPVAVIVIGPDRVRVEPIMDVVKVALAFFTMFGSLLAMTKSIRSAGNS